MGFKISGLPAAGALTGTESVPIVQSGITSKTTAQDIANLTSLAAGATLFLNRQASNATGTVAFPTDFFPAAGSTYSLGGLSLSWQFGTFDGMKKRNGVTVWDVLNDRLNDGSGNASIYLDSKLLRTGSHAAPVTKFDWSGDPILYNTTGATMLGTGASALSFHMNLLPQADETLVIGSATAKPDLIATSRLGIYNSSTLRYTFRQQQTSGAGNAMDGFVASTSAPSTPIGGFAQDDSTADANQAKGIRFEASNKTAGTGAGGDVLFRPGSSAGGTAGVFGFVGDHGAFSFPKTVTAGGTTGNQTINKVTGTVNIAAAGSSVTVTCAQCSASSIVFAVVRTNDATALIKNVVPGAGSFVITMNAAVTAETSIGFLVMN